MRFRALAVGFGFVSISMTALAQSDAPSGSPAPHDPNTSGEAYVVRQRNVQAQVEGLRTEVFDSEARLQLLAERYLGSTVAGGRATIEHQNEMSPLYRLVRATYTVDGHAVSPPVPAGDARNFAVFTGPLEPGPHTLIVDLEYQGRGHSVFPYWEGYRMHVHSTQSFTVERGHEVRLQVVGYEQGGVFADPTARPGIRFLEQSVPLSDTQR
jgi:hypothetical protein